MDYCPEIAVLHGAFSLVDSESKRDSTNTLLQHKKGDTSSKPYRIIKCAVQEIITGLESTRTLPAQNQWAKRLFSILFQKTFTASGDADKAVTLVPNGLSKSDDAKTVEALDFEPAETSLEELRKRNKYKSVCFPLPELHPFFFFDLMEDMKWTGFLGEEFAKGKLSSSLKCATACLEYISSEPSSSYDLDLISTTLNFLTSCCVYQIMQNLETDNQLVKQERSFQCLPTWERKFLDEDDVSVLVELLTKLLDRAVNILKSIPKDTEDKEWVRSAGDTLSCCFLIWMMSLSVKTVSELAETLSTLFVSDDDDDDDDTELSPKSKTQESVVPGHTEETESGASATSQDQNSFNLQEHLLLRLRDAIIQIASTDCISTILLHRFFPVDENSDSYAPTTPSTQLSGGGSGDTRVRGDNHESSSWGTVLDLEFKILATKPPVKMVRLLSEVSWLMQPSPQLSSDTPMFTADVQTAFSGMLKEMARREEKEEERRQNPTLAEVTERIEKRLPRWKRCLEFGLAKRDLSGWWFSGFLDLLRRHGKVLQKEVHVTRLLAVMTDIVQQTPQPDSSGNISVLAELIITVFNRLPLLAQEGLILRQYLSQENPQLPLVPNFDQALTVAFNKLSATSTSKDLQGVLKLALHDPLTLLEHAVRVAVASAGQISIVVKVLRQLPEVCRCVHPQKHPNNSLLVHCMQTLMSTHKLDSTEQKNVLTLVSSLVQVHGQDSSQPLLLSPVEFLSALIFPSLSVQSASSPSIPSVSTDLALRLLAAVLEATLAAGFSHWLRDVQPACLIVLCGEMLDACVELARETGDVDAKVRTKSLVLTVLELLHRHFSQLKEVLEGKNLLWVQRKCTEYDWTVSVYLSDFLTPVCDSGDVGNQLLSQLAVECVKVADVDPLPLLHLAAISESAKERILLSLQESTPALVLYETAVLSALCKLLPHLLVPEVRRVVHLLHALIGAGCLDIRFRCLFTHSFSMAAFRESASTVCLSQLLMDTFILMKQHPWIFTSQATCIYLAQLLVAGLQELLQGVPAKQQNLNAATFQQQQIFSHVCVIMSAVPAAFHDPLFVVLLDLATKLQAVTATDNFDPVSDVTKEALQLIPSERMQETILKRLETKNES